MTQLKTLHERWAAEPAYQKAYDALDDEFALVTAITQTRSRAGLTQEEVAQPMRTTQGNIALLDAGRTRPSVQNSRSVLSRLAPDRKSNPRYVKRALIGRQVKAGCRQPVFCAQRPLRRVQVIGPSKSWVADLSPRRTVKRTSRRIHPTALCAARVN